MLVTLAIAIATRLHIAGDGTGTGIAAMIFCTVVGFAWHLRTQRKQFRTRADYLRLGVLTCLGLWTVVLLPTPVAFAVLTQAAPVLLALYLVFVPLTGYLLDRELTMLRLETMQRGSSGIDLDTGLLSRKAFEREAEVLRASNGVVAVATIRVRHLSRLARLWGTDKTGLALAALRARLRGVLSHADTVGRLREDTLAVPLTRAEFDRWDSLARTVDAALVDRPLDFGEGGLLGLRLDLSTRPLPGPDRPAAQPGTQPIRTTG
jgi:GGDEF domain-containing protein